jgi:PAS domain S-box-containing protein
MNLTKYLVQIEELKKENALLKQELQKATTELNLFNQNEDKFKNVVEASPNGFILVDDKGIITLVNKKTESIFGYTRDELLGQKVEVLIPKVHRHNHEHYRNEYFEKPVTRAMGVGRDLFGLHKNGSQIPVEIGLNPMITSEGTFVLASIIDITKRKQDEAALKESEQEIKQKNEELTRFIYTVSHDLKSPLVTIKSFTSYLIEDVQNDDKKAQSKDILYINNAVDKMGRLLDELLELARIGKKEDPKSEIPLKTIAQSAVDLVAGRIAQRKVKVKITGPDVILYGHQPRLLQLYQNLIDNAVKFMGEQSDPIIEIGSFQETTNNQIVLYIRDNGSGIDPKYHDKVFGLFEKLDAASEGTGIGLALVKKIVEVHGGSIWFTSEGKGKGTTFCFTLEKSFINKK